MARPIEPTPPLTAGDPEALLDELARAPKTPVSVQRERARAWVQSVTATKRTPLTDATAYASAHRGPRLDRTAARAAAMPPTGLKLAEEQKWRREFAEYLAELGLARRTTSGPAGESLNRDRNLRATEAEFAEMDRLAGQAGLSWNRWVLWVVLEKEG